MGKKKDYCDFIELNKNAKPNTKFQIQNRKIVNGIPLKLNLLFFSILTSSISPSTYLL